MRWDQNWAASWQNQQNDLCAQQRLGSAWASAQSDQSSLSAWRNIGPLTPIERTVKTLIRLGECPGLSEYSLGTRHFVDFVMRQLKSFATLKDSYNHHQQPFFCSFCSTAWQMSSKLFLFYILPKFPNKFFPSPPQTSKFCFKISKENFTQMSR